MAEQSKHIRYKVSVTKMLQSKVGSSAEYKDKVESANPKAGNVTEQQSGESLQSIKPG